MNTLSLPTREAVLASGLPEGLVDHLRQQTRIDRARAMGTLLAAVFRNLVPRRLPPAGRGLAPT
jgi:hypothetical protein